MQIVRDLVAGCGCIIIIWLICDGLLTLHDIRDELRASREYREAQAVPHKLS